MATSIHLIYWDLQRYALNHNDPTRTLLEKHILLTVGLPSLERRYKMDSKCNHTLQDYVFTTQFQSNDALRQRAHQVLDYFYSKAEDENLDARVFLQVQKMDARNAEAEIINETTIAFKPHITGKAAEFIAQQFSRESFFSTVRPPFNIIFIVLAQLCGKPGLYFNGLDLHSGIFG